MASPQKEDGYTAIANEIIDKGFFKHRIPGEQMLCLWVIIRKTYGYNKKWDMISNSQFVKLLGLKKQSVNRAIQGLVDKNMISVSKKAYNSMPSYCFNKNYKTWKLSAKKLTVSKSADSSKQKSLQPVSKKAAHKRQPTKDNVTKDNTTSKKVPSEKTVTLKTITLTTLEKDIDDFDLFWKQYPRKIGKQECMKIWLNPKKKKLRPHVEDILDTLAVHKISEDWIKDDGKYIPHPSTWLNRGGWDDELRMPSKPKAKELEPQTYAQAQDAERRETVKILKEMRDAGKSKGDSGGAPQIEHILPGSEEVFGGD